jgi:hypothetical protein
MKFSVPVRRQIMTHLALPGAIHMLEVAAGGTASLLEALQWLMLNVLRSFDCYLFSSFSRSILLV